MQGEANTSTQSSTAPVSGKCGLLKDLMIPLSIIIAGMFIGAGLYFSGGSAKSTGPLTLTDKLTALAEEAGADEDDFTACLENGDTTQAVQEDYDNGVATGGKGTPWAILIGPTGKKYSINGALPQQQIEQLIELAKAEAGTSPADTEEAKALEALAPVSESDHIKGDRNAKIVIVEYSDFDCPFCTRFHTTMNAIVKKYQANEVAWVYRHFPLEALHPDAKTVAAASECVAKLEGNEAFWKFADAYLK